jgi:hypothetical protein
MFFPDLSIYDYGRVEPKSTVLNVGWLSKNHVFAIGDVSPEIIATLRRLVSTPINQYRGLHACEFCPPPTTYVTPQGLRLANPAPETSGNGEVHVAASNGLTYVAPALIAHYVEVHKYLPPAEFIKAVASINVTSGA